MQFDQKDPFGYPLGTYIWVFGVALIGGAVKYLNQSSRFSFVVLVRDLVTACFAGLLTFWVCEWMNIGGPLSAALIAVSGLMGTRALRGFETFWQMRMGLPGESSEDQERHSKLELDIKVSGGDDAGRESTRHEGE